MNKVLLPLKTGYKLLLSETKWIFLKTIRRWEIRQLQKRLGQEYQTLGQSFAEAQLQDTTFDPCSTENDLTLRQILFLRDEVAHLENELVASRAEYVTKRLEGA